MAVRKRAPRDPQTFCLESPSGRHSTGEGETGQWCQYCSAEIERTNGRWQLVPDPAAVTR